MSAMVVGLVLSMKALPSANPHAPIPERGPREVSEH